MTTTRTVPGADLVATRFTLDASGVARLTLHRPDAANARNQQMRTELARVYDFVASGDEVAVLVLTGAGDRFFCAGMDLKESAGGETPEERRARLRASRDIDTLAALPVPTIAAINGYALGGGLEMALACDLRVMAQEAQLGLPELTHGLVPGGGGTQRLPRLIGPARTLELLYTGSRIDGTRAAELGIVNRAVPREDLKAEVDALTATITTLPRAAVRSAKDLVVASAEVPLAEGLARELDALLDLLDARST